MDEIDKLYEDIQTQVDLMGKKKKKTLENEEQRTSEKLM